MRCNCQDYLRASWNKAALLHIALACQSNGWNRTRLNNSFSTWVPPRRLARAHDCACSMGERGNNETLKHIETYAFLAAWFSFPVGAIWIHLVRFRLLVTYATKNQARTHLSFHWAAAQLPSRYQLCYCASYSSQGSSVLLPEKMPQLDTTGTFEVLLPGQTFRKMW